MPRRSMACGGRERAAREGGKRQGAAMSDHDIGCEEALKRLFELLDGELSDTEQGDVERHLRTCRSCFSRMEFEQRLKQRLAALSAEDAPAALRSRIHGLIRGFEGPDRPEPRRSRQHGVVECQAGVHPQGSRGDVHRRRVAPRRRVPLSDGSPGVPLRRLSRRAARSPAGGSHGVVRRRRLSVCGECHPPWRRRARHWERIEGPTH